MEAVQRAELLETFVLDAYDALGGFEEIVNRLRGGVTGPALHDLSVIAHRVKGSAALYDYPQLSRLGGLVEELAERLQGAEAITPEGAAKLTFFLEQVLTCLQGGLESIGRSGDEGELGLQLAQMGGSRGFLELLRAHPKSFVRKGLAAKKALGETQLGLIEELRRFYAQDADTWEFFAPEVGEHIDAIRDVLGEVASGKTSRASDAHLTRLFRATHTLKGSAYMVGLTPMGELAHGLEDLMVTVREEGRPLGEVVAALHAGANALSDMLQSAQGRDVGVRESVKRAQREIAKGLGLESPTTDSLTDNPVDAAEASASDAETGAVGAKPYLELTRKLRAFPKRNADTWGFFAPEAGEHIDAVHEALDTLAGGYSEDALNQVFRAAHTLKGAAFMADLPEMGRLAHGLESLMVAVREEGMAFDEIVLGVLRSGNESLRLMLETAEALTESHAAAREAALEGALRETGEGLVALLGEAAPQVVEAEAVAEASGDQSDTATETAPSAIIRVRLDKLDTLMNLAGDMVAARARLERQVEAFGGVNTVLETSRTRLLRTVSEFEEKYLNPRLTAMTKTVTQDASKTVLGKTGQEGAEGERRGLGATTSEMFDELEFDSYNDLNILARSVAEMANDLTEIQAQLAQIGGGLAAETETIQKLSRSLRGEVGRARLVPVRGLFSRLKRLLVAGEGKSFTLTTSGEGTEIDNVVLEAVADPMLHLVKNAVAHGIESEESRVKKGKPAQGRVSLRAYHQSNYVFIEVQDDGAGVDVARVKAKAVAKGFRSQAEVDAMSDAEATALIFLPGLSTKDEVTTQAGRGVGMDVVAENVRRLKGEIGVSSEWGRGARFTLKLPLTLLVSEALRVGVGDQTFAFPVSAVRALRTAPRSSLTQDGGEKRVMFENRALPLLPVRALLGLPAADAGGDAGDAGPDASFVVLETGNGAVAAEVDAFLDIEEMVIRGLDAMLARLSYLSGAAVSNTGEVVLVLDPAGLLRLSQGAANPLASAQAPAQVRETKRRLLLVDDSISVRRVVGKMLTRAGFDVVLASDGQDALEKLLVEARFDAVLTDLEMPRVNGYELLEEVRRKPDTAALPVIVMTTRAGDKHMRLALELGATHYFAKPVDEAKLLRALQL